MYRTAESGTDERGPTVLHNPGNSIAPLRWDIPVARSVHVLDEEAVWICDAELHVLEHSSASPVASVEPPKSVNDLP